MADNHLHTDMSGKQHDEIIDNRGRMEFWRMTHFTGILLDGARGSYPLVSTVVIGLSFLLLRSIVTFQGAANPLTFIQKLTP